MTLGHLSLDEMLRHQIRQYEIWNSCELAWKEILYFKCIKNEVERETTLF